MRVDGLDNSYWIAVGVSLQTDESWSYGSETFFGSNSVGNIMGPQEKEISGSPTYVYNKTQHNNYKALTWYHRWNDGDIVSIELDCDFHTVEVTHNGVKKPTLTIPDKEVWPWVNIYQAGASVHLIPWAEKW